MATNPRVTGGDWREIDAVFRPVFDDLARSAREFARLDDPVDAECWISELLAMCHGMPLVGEPDAEVALGQGLVRAAARKPSNASKALLLGLAALAPAAVATKAKAADRRMDRARRPFWANAIGAAAFTSGWRATDVFGARPSSCSASPTTAGPSTALWSWWTTTWAASA